MDTMQIIQKLLDMGIIQREIARESGVPQPTLSKWSHNGAPAAADNALKLKTLLEKKLADRV